MAICLILSDLFWVSSYLQNVMSGLGWNAHFFLESLFLSLGH